MFNKALHSTRENRITVIVIWQNQILIFEKL